jgi:hypothetical protein
MVSVTISSLAMFNFAINILIILILAIIISFIVELVLTHWLTYFVVAKTKHIGLKTFLLQN